jgi:uncharacterized protein YcfJ
MEIVMKTLSACSLLSLILCLGFSADALADGHSRQAQQRQQAYRVAPHKVTPHRVARAQRPPVVITRYAPPQRRVVVSAPTVVYRAPTVVYQQPVYYYTPAPVVVYESAPPQVILQASLPAPSVEDRQGGLSAAQVVGAVAGGVIGSRFGGGNGRLATTAAGAVLGSVLAEELASDR